MWTDENGSASAGPRLQARESGPLSELERLRATCRRQATMIDSLSEAVSTLSRGAKALKAENCELRAETARLSGFRRLPSRTERAGDAGLAEVAIPLGIQAPGVARSVVAGCLAERVASPVLENAQLLVSELVTNSVRHSGAPEGDDVIVRVNLWRDMCRLEVEDHGRDGLIAPRPPDRFEGSGMGLNLVQMLSERWGVVRDGEGPTRVWAQLSCAAALA
jgi:serine/threonine-protein kinase RsbW